MSLTSGAFKVGMLLLAMGFAFMLVQYTVAVPIGIEMAVLDIPVVPIGVAMIVVGAISTAWALRP